MEFIYVNEFGPYINKISDLPQIPNVIVIDKKSIFAYNLNSEITFRINKNNNIGYGLFFGRVLFLDKEKTQNNNGFFNGFILKYNHKDFTISVINEHSAGSIESTRVGITYKFLNKQEPVNE